MSDENSQREPLDVLAEEFVGRFRNGERPSLTEYVSQHPDIADEIRELFPTLAMMEVAGADVGQSGSSIDRVSAGVESLPQQLGDYRILREIGRGGMGVVYEAEQISLGRHVALKVLPYHALLDEQQKQRFLREAQAVAGLQHPNIVPVFAIGEHEGIHFYAMQYIHGHGLDEVQREISRLRRVSSQPQSPSEQSQGVDNSGLQLSETLALNLLTREHERGSAAVRPTAEEKRGSSQSGGNGSSILQALSDSGGNGSSSAAAESSDALSSEILKGGSGITSGAGRSHYFRSIARVGTQVAEALDYAHGQGVLHRDIKPSNLLLDSRGLVWVTDFGLAKTDQEDDLTHPGDLIGTLRYMAPERFKGWSDPRSDVYSLGLTMYELLTLQPAFGEIDRARLIKQVAHEEPPPPRKLDPHIPHDLETVVLKAIAKESTGRYQSAAEMANDLRRFLAGEPIHARRTPLRERAWLWCRRNSAVASLMGLVAVLLVVISVGASLSWIRLREKHDAVLGNLNRALQAEQEARRAERVARDAHGKEHEARQQSDKNLYRAHLAQGMAIRWSGREGRRFQSLAAIKQAAGLARTLALDDEAFLDLRNEAIACMTLLDLRPDKQWPGHRPVSQQVRIAFDADLERYSRLEPEGEIVVRRLSDNQELVRLPGIGTLHNRPYLRFSPDGRFLAIVGLREGRLFNVLWDLQTRERRMELRSGGRWTAMNADFSSDSRLVAFCDPKGSVSVYETESGLPHQQIGQGKSSINDYPSCIRFHPRDGQLAVARARDIELLDLEHGTLRRLARFNVRVRGLAWSPDGRQLASGSFRTVYVIDAQSGKWREMQEQHEGVVRYVAFNHRGDLLASTGWDNATRLWDFKTGRQILVAREFGIAFSRDDRWLGIGAAGSSIGRFEIATGQECSVLRGSSVSNVDCVAISPDGHVAAVSLPDGVHLWDVRNRQQIGRVPVARSRFVAFSDSGDTLWLACRSGVQAWPVQLTENGWTVGPPKVVTAASHRTDLGVRADMSRDGRMLALAKSYSSDTRVTVLDLDQPNSQTVLKHGYCVHMAISPDNAWVATGTRRGRGIRIWESGTGDLVKELDIPSSARVAFSPDGRYLVTSSQSEHVVWNCGSWTAKYRIAKRKDDGDEGPLAFSARGDVLALTDTPRSIQLINPETGRPIAALVPPQREPITSLCFSNDAALLLAGTTVGTVQVWDLAAIREQLSNMGLDWTDEFKKGSGTVVRSTLRAVPATVPDPFLNQAGFPEQETAAQTLWPDQKAGGELEIVINLGYWPDYARGIEHARTERWNEAIESYSKALQHEDTLANIWLDRAEAYSKLGRSEQAIADASKAIELAPRNPLAWSRRASVVYHSAYHGTGDSAQFERVRTDLDQVLRLDPTDASARQLRGSMHLYLGDYDGAIADWDLLRNVDTDNWKFCRMIGQAMLRKGEFENASRSLSEAIQKKPDHTQNYKIRAYCSVGLGDEQPAIRDLNYYLKKSDPFARKPYWHLENELKRWTKLVTVHADSAAARVGRAKAHAQLGRWDESLTDIRRAVELHDGPTSKPAGPLRFLDLEPYANRRMDRKIYYVVDNDMRELPPGEYGFNGIPFRIGKRFISLGGERWPERPLRKQGIAVDTTLAKLHFLHNAFYETDNAVRIGEYRVHYEDDSTELIPLVYGHNVSSWDYVQLGSGPVAWVGTNPLSRRQTRWVFLRRLTWTNPHPEKHVSSIDFISAGKKSVPFCVAISVEAP